MLYFMDTEFFEDGTTIDLISIALMAEDGRELYACNSDARLDLASRDSWMEQNVLAQLPPYGRKAWMRKQGNWNCPGIREAIMSFMLKPEDIEYMRSTMTSSLDRCGTRDGKKPEIWGYYSSTDWVAFYQIFGRMIDLPKQFPKHCLDLKQLSDSLNAPKFPKPTTGAHNALTDARWNRDLYKYLMGLKAQKESGQ